MGRGLGVSAGLGVGEGLGVEVGVAVGVDNGGVVAVAVTVAVGVAVGVGVGVGLDWAQYLPPVFVTVGGVLAGSGNLLGRWTLFATCPPQTIILLPVHTAV